MTSNLQQMFNNALYQTSMIAGFVGKPAFDEIKHGQKVKDTRAKLDESSSSIETLLGEYESRPKTKQIISEAEAKAAQEQIRQHKASSKDLLTLAPSAEHAEYGIRGKEFSKRLKSLSKAEKERSEKASAAAKKGAETRKANKQKQAAQAASESLAKAAQEKRNKTQGGLVDGN